MTFKSCAQLHSLIAQQKIYKQIEQTHMHAHADRDQGSLTVVVTSHCDRVPADFLDVPPCRKHVKRAMAGHAELTIILFTVFGSISFNSFWRGRLDNHVSNYLENCCQFESKKHRTLIKHQDYLEPFRKHESWVEVWKLYKTIPAMRFPSLEMDLFLKSSLDPHFGYPR